MLAHPLMFQASSSLYRKMQLENAALEELCWLCRAEGHELRAQCALGLQYRLVRFDGKKAVLIPLDHGSGEFSLVFDEVATVWMTMNLEHSGLTSRLRLVDSSGLVLWTLSERQASCRRDSAFWRHVMETLLSDYRMAECAQLEAIDYGQAPLTNEEESSIELLEQEVERLWQENAALTRYLAKAQRRSAVTIAELHFTIESLRDQIHALKSNHYPETHCVQAQPLTGLA